MDCNNLARVQQSSYQSFAMCQPIRRVACHHCGNIRKNQVKCVACPQLYCKNCAEKIKLEHGIQVFAEGCPVCQKLCCCADKSPLCTRKHHCYRKCPVSKSGVTAPPVSIAPANEKPSHRELSNVVSPTSSSNCCLPLDLLAAACEQFGDLAETKGPVLSSKSSRDELSVSTSIEDVSDISSSSGEEESIKSNKKTTSPVDLARASCLPSSDGVADLAISQPPTACPSPRRAKSIASNKRSYSDMAGFPPSYVAALPNALSAASMLPFPSPFEWWRSQNYLMAAQKQQKMLETASKETFAGTATTPTLVWVPVPNSAVNGASMFQGSGLDTKRARSSTTDLLSNASAYHHAQSASATSAGFLPQFELEYAPRIVQDRVVYDWVVRPSLAQQAAATNPMSSTSPALTTSMYYNPLLSAQYLGASASTTASSSSISMDKQFQVNASISS